MVLKTCRCCCSQVPLGKAVKVIGVVFAVMGFISVIVEAVSLSKLDSVHSLVDANLDQLTKPNGKLTREQLQEMLEHARKIQVIRLVAVIAFFVFSLILVAGVHRQNACLVLTFTIYFFLYMILMTIVTFYAFYDPTVFINESSVANLNQQDTKLAKIVIYVSLAITLTIFVFFWYLAVVIYSYYQQLVRGETFTEPSQNFKF